jgi:hypothetical protein
MSGDRGPGTNRAGAECRRTLGVIDRIVAGTLTATDREHAATCPRCGPVLARSVQFDDALRRTARSMAGEELPRGVLDPGLAGGPGGVRRGPALRSFAPGLAGMAAAIAILILATGIPLPPGAIVNPTVSAPPVESSLASTAPLFRSSASIASDLRGQKYVCNPGNPIPTSTSSLGRAEREGVVCEAPKEDTTKSAALITIESEAGDVISIAIKGDLVGTDTVAATERLASAMAKLAFAAVADPVDAPVIGEWVNGAIPKLRVLPRGDAAVNAIGEIRLTLERSASGNFFLLLEPEFPS